ncbi:MAG: hypothetical protein JWN40_2271 [Phycisphaerales bacterium]|nr:hypothetical protein [Phycisphaerales bacterium]
MSRRMIFTRTVAARLPLLCVAFLAQALDPVAAQEKERTNLARWLAEKRIWEDLPAIAGNVDSDEPEVRANAVLAFGNLWDANLALAKPRE